MATLDKATQDSMYSSGFLVKKMHGPFFKEDFEGGDMGEYELMCTFISINEDLADDFVEVYFLDVDTYEKTVSQLDDDFLVELTPSFMQKVHVS